MHLIGQGPARARFRVYDPRQGVDFRLETRQSLKPFSSLKEGFLVILGERLDWIRCAVELDGLLRAADPFSFVLFRPWSPRTRSKVDAFNRAFRPSMNALEPEQFALFSDGRPLAEQALSFVRNQGPSCGVVLVGSVGDQSTFPAAFHSANFHFDDMLSVTVDCSASLSVALGLDEGADSSLFVKLSESTTPPADRILNALKTFADCIPTTEAE